MSFGFSLGDIIACSKLAVQTYNALKDAPAVFEGLRLEFRSLNSVLKALADEQQSPTSLIHSAAPQRREDMRLLLEDCTRNMNALQALALKYSSYDLERKRRIFKRMAFAAESKQGARDKLAVHTASINMFLATLTNTGLGRLEFLIKYGARSLDSTGDLAYPSFAVVGMRDPKAAAGTRDPNTQVAGARDPNAMAAVHAGSNGERWKAVWKELADEGVTDAHVERYHEDLKAYMRYLVCGKTPFWKDISVLEQTMPASDASLEGPSSKPMPEARKEKTGRVLERERMQKELAERAQILQEQKRKTEVKSEQGRRYQGAAPGAALSLTRTTAELREWEAKRRALLAELAKTNTPATQARLETELEKTEEVIDERTSELRRFEKAEIERRLKEAEMVKQQLEAQELARRMRVEMEEKAYFDSELDSETDEFLDELNGLFEPRETPLEAVLPQIPISPAKTSPEHTRISFDLATQRSHSSDADSRLFDFSPQSSHPSEPSTKSYETTSPFPARRMQIQALREELKRLLSRLKRAEEERDMALESDIRYYALPVVMDALEGLDVKLQKRYPLRWASCDNCWLPVVEARWHCDFCRRGDWDTCGICWGEGVKCLDRGHEMREIGLDGEKK